ncbi:hypothetical protein HU761_19435 [Pseudomonas sp. SWRI59]|uniref:hypothetical protein n=1 Tax=unclassified Pseudomonas TaxID=196821 RepID=UPI001647862A|nr:MULTISPECIES: hypothetical protein [unclassified Pseudomonas]MBC3503573.1 hypothetical protein [Pseudomonas sp. SWRI59]MBC3507456.1 hypothetical protein [Pseudomonas sp. SWRI68]
MAFTMIPLKNEDENFCGAEFSATAGSAAYEAGSGFQNLTFNAFGDESYPSMVMGAGMVGNGSATTMINIDSGVSVSFTISEAYNVENPARSNAMVAAVFLSDGQPMFTKSYFLKESDLDGNWVDTKETGVYVGGGFSISMPNRMASPYLATFQYTDVHTVKIKVAVSLAPGGAGSINATAKVDFPEEDKAAGFTTRERRAIDESMRTNEGNTDHMYLDSLGNVTVGVGFMLPSESAAAEYPFLNSDNGPATIDQKQSEWRNIHSSPRNYVAGWYKSRTSLHLTSEFVDFKLGALVDSSFSGLSRLFPEIDKYPGAARVALQDMIYNVGEGGLGDGFPRLMEAVRDQDWLTAATESHRNIRDESRNNAIRDLFLNAAGSGDF